MNSSYDKQKAVKKAIDKEVETELELIRINTGEKPKLIPGTSFIDDRRPITHGRRR